MLQGQVSLGRVQDFMYAEEIDTSIINSNKDESDNVAIRIKNGNFAWTTDETKEDASKKDQKPSSSIQPNPNFFKDPSNLILKNINIDIKKGSFVAILGE